MRIPSEIEFDRLWGNQYPPSQKDLNYRIRPCKKQLRNLLILKGKNYHSDLKKIKNEYAYQWLLFQDSHTHVNNKLIKSGYKSAQIKAFGTPNENRWGEEWATKMSHWVINEALGPIEKYNHKKEPETIRLHAFHSLVYKIQDQPVDPWLRHVAFSLQYYLYPDKAIKDIKEERSKNLKKYNKTLGIIDSLLNELDDEEYINQLLKHQKKEGLFYVGDYKTTIINIANAIQFKSTIIQRDNTQYAKADDDIDMRIFIRSIWHWLNYSGLGSKPSVIFSLLAMPELSPYALSTRSVESLIQKLKQETHQGNLPGVSGSAMEGPFGFSTDGQFQLRMMDTSLYRS